MHCRRCKVAMVEKGRSYHKRRKWTCPKCGRSKMQTPQKIKGVRASRGRAGTDGDA